MFQRGFFLVVVREDGLAQTLLQPMQRYVVTRRVRSFEEALPLLRQSSRWSGVVVDLDLLRRREVHALTQLRQVQPLVPVLALSSAPRAALINALHTLRAELICKPVGADNVTCFVERALVAGWLPDERVTAWVNELARRHELTSREVQLIAYALGNESRQQVMRRLGITENTLKTQVRMLLRKCKARTMDALAKNVLREALLFDDERSAPAFPSVARTSLEESGEYCAATA